VLLCSLQADVKTNISGASATDAADAAADNDDANVVAYHVTKTEFIACRPLTSSVVSTLSAFSVYDRLQSNASNYFIGESC